MAGQLSLRSRTLQSRVRGWGSPLPLITPQLLQVASKALKIGIFRCGHK